MKIKPKKKVLTWRNKHFARDIARSCEMPYEEAVKLLQVILKLWQVKLKSEGKLVLRKLGTLKISKLKRPNDRAAYRIITFHSSERLSTYLGNIANRNSYKYEIHQAHKIRRLLLAGDKSRAKQLYGRLIIRLETRPETKQYLLDKKHLPI